MSNFEKGLFLGMLLCILDGFLSYIQQKREAKKCNYVCENCKYFPCTKWDCERWKNRIKKNSIRKNDKEN